MKRNLILVIFIIVAFLVVINLPVKGTSAEDYKVIKNAVGEKQTKTSGEVTSLRIQVKDKKNQKENVNITLPISLVEMAFDCFKDEPKFKEKCKFDLKKVIDELKKNGPATLIEVDDENETVKIWFE